MIRDLNYVLNYMYEYVKNEDMHDSEPMLNYRDIELVLRYIQELQEEIERQSKAQVILDDEITERDIRLDKSIKDIEFCLKSIIQESEMSTDERTKKEMKTCIQIFNETLDNLKGEDSND